jgi:hypothetical protein
MEVDQHYRRHRRSRCVGNSDYEDSSSGTQITTIADIQNPSFNNRGQYCE